MKILCRLKVAEMVKELDNLILEKHAACVVEHENDADQEQTPTIFLSVDTSQDFFQLNLSLDLAEAQAVEKRTVFQGESKEWL